MVLEGKGVEMADVVNVRKTRPQPPRDNHINNALPAVVQLRLAAEDGLCLAGDDVCSPATLLRVHRVGLGPRRQELAADAAARVLLRLGAALVADAADEGLGPGFIPGFGFCRFKVRAVVVFAVVVASGLHLGVVVALARPGASRPPRGPAVAVVAGVADGQLTHGFAEGSELLSRGLHDGVENFGGGFFDGYKSVQAGARNASKNTNLAYDMLNAEATRANAEAIRVHHEVYNTFFPAAAPRTPSR
mmetsp:Transcript_6152/g.19723  ORF Transcript_6152/g.19723 Transcript_6152/m.19723 type:complete len:247 (+) Transcript_6152:359-1099(+)